MEILAQITDFSLKQLTKMKRNRILSYSQRNNKPIFANNLFLKAPRWVWRYEFSKSEKTFRATFFNR